jgi:hypothetical protein
MSNFLTNIILGLVIFIILNLIGMYLFNSINFLNWSISFKSAILCFSVLLPVMRFLLIANNNIENK